MGWLIDFFKEVKLTVTQRKELIDAEREIDRLREKNAGLEKAKAELSKKVMELEKELAEHIAFHEQFTEDKGVLFKRKPSGGYFEVVYCPHCRIPLSPAHRDGRRDYPFLCSKCNLKTVYTIQQLMDAIKDLEKYE